MLVNASASLFLVKSSFFIIFLATTIIKLVNGRYSPIVKPSPAPKLKVFNSVNDGTVGSISQRIILPSASAVINYLIF